MSRKLSAPHQMIIASRSRHCALRILLFAFIAWQAPPPVNAQPAPRKYLSAGNIALAGITSVSLGVVGQLVKTSNRTKRTRWSNPLPLERWLVPFLGGDCTLNKSNFLDNRAGSVVTPLVAFGTLVAADFTWPQDRPGKDAAEDAFLFASGFVATKGVTGLAKGFFSRQRPLPCLEPGLAFERHNINESYDNQSFFSGHASGAFYSSAFLNLRLRSIMRQRLSGEDYNSWRWAPPTILFGWSTFVGWSRIHAYKHYPSDVIAGALAGILIAELFYSFADNRASEAPSGFPQPAARPSFIRFRISF